MNKRASVLGFSAWSLAVALIVAAITGMFSGKVGFGPISEKLDLPFRIAFPLLSAALGYFLSEIAVSFVKAVQVNRSLIESIRQELGQFEERLETMCRDILYKTLHLRPYKIADRPDEASLETLLGELTVLKKKDLAFSFAIDSLKRVKETGFVQVKIGVEDYSTFLKDCCVKVEKVLYVICKVRPLWFFANANRREHLKHFKTSAADNKVRLVILKNQEISDIIQNTLENLRITDTFSRSVSELPEILFFLEEINAAPMNFRVYWALEWPLVQPGGSTYECFNRILDPQGSIPDFAIFDEDFVLKFEFVGESKGNMSLEWGDLRRRHTLIFDKIISKDPSPPDELENWCQQSNADLEAIKIYRTFKNLCEKQSSQIVTPPLPDKPPEFSIENVDDDICKLLGLNKASPPNLKDFLDKGFYQKIIDNLEAGKLKLRPEYQITTKSRKMESLAVRNIWDEWVESKNLMD